ncbi:MAG: S41 family peptidase, partial [Gammaproteobacteria bacterium]|nr:S41 family peptidase [Gammaproteobacteria bacterium]
MSPLFAYEELANQESDSKEQSKVTIPFDEIRVFADIFSRVKKDYVEPVEDKTLMESAIRGMLSGLDPHSSYLNDEEYKDLHEGTTGEFGGLGIEVGLEDGFVKVIAPIDDTPAQRAGVKAGDIIIRLDDKSVKGISLDEAVKMMRGKPGDPIVLTIVREGEEKPLKIKIVRAVIKVTSVKSRALEPGYYYLRITQFQSHTAELLRKAIERLRTEDKGPVKGVVLDLRNNPGGVLNGAVSVSDIFLEDGLIVYTEGRTKDSASRFHAKPGDMIDGVPMVVIVNGGSASASEIVAGALQDHKRAIILGEKTFGKGSVQTILPMNNGDAIKLTTARYYTPSGNSIQAKGIVPDIELHSIKVARSTDKEFLQVKESQLSGHLKNGKSKDEKKAELKNQKKT